jgi:hypothetical protein
MQPKSNKERLLNNPFPLNKPQQSSINQPTQSLDPLHTLPMVGAPFVKMNIEIDPLAQNYAPIQKETSKNHRGQ